MRRWAIEVVETALQRETCDFVQDVAYLLPMHMTADIVGIPFEDRKWLFDLTKDFLAVGNPDSPISPEQGLAIRVRMFQYAQDLGRRKRECPEDDIWTILTNVEIESDDGVRSSLSQTELDFFFLLLAIAGSETTRNAIALGLVALLDHPEQLEALREDPGAMRPAIEEILARTREIELLYPPVFSPLSIWNPVMVAPREIPVRLA
jgi:cytochrome P450